MQGDLNFRYVQAALQYEGSKGKAIPLHAWTGPQVSRSLRLPDFKTIGNEGCQYIYYNQHYAHDWSG